MRNPLVKRLQVTPVYRKTAVMHEGDIKVKSVKLLTKKNNLRVWEIDTVEANINYVFVEHPFDEFEKGSPQLMLTTDSNSLDAEHYTLIGIGVRDCAGWRFVTQFNPSRATLVAYRLD
jgi:hypothetical protein